MGKELRNSILIILVLTSSVAVLQWLGSSDILDTFANEKNETMIKRVKQLCNIVSIVVPTLILIIWVEKLKHDLRVAKSQKEGILYYLKNASLLALERHTDIEKLSKLNMRIWVEDKRYFTSKKLFRIQNIANLAGKDNSDNLKLEVHPRQQGLVGMCYNEKEIVYENNVQTSNSNFNLDNFQISKTSETKFVLCVPIFNEQDNVSSIVSFDLNEEIDIPEDDEIHELLRVHFRAFCQQLYENVPDLFK